MAQTVVVVAIRRARTLASGCPRKALGPEIKGCDGNVAHPQAHNDLEMATRTIVFTLAVAVRTRKLLMVDPTGTEAGVAQPLSTYILPGRITEPAVGLQEAVDAEQAGFSRVWISERYDLKELGVLSGAVAARTSRIGVASGLAALPARHPLLLAAYAATMQATFGERLLLGVGGGFTPLLA